ncbi:unnamed protein product, partial [Polarella glacialis]
SSSVVVFSLQLVDFEKLDVFGTEVQESFRVAHCARRKEVGTCFFQQGNWHRALKRYQVVTSHLSYLEHWKDEAAKGEALLLRKACHLNIAACWLKLEAWREATESCSEVLRDEPGSVKALFRRGQALKELGEFRDAEHCFRKVLEVDKDNKDAARMLLKLRQSVKAEVEQKKEMFSRMARGIGSKSEAAVSPAAVDTPETVIPGASEPRPREPSRQDPGEAVRFKPEAEEVEEVKDEDDEVLWILGATAFLLTCASVGYWLSRRSR